MSLNKYEQQLFDYVEANPEERRHWREKVVAASRRLEDAGVVERDLERELWEYFAERSEHVPRLRELNAGGLRRVSLLNLSGFLLRRFGEARRRPPAGQPGTASAHE